MQQDDYRRELEIATKLARQAGEVILAHFDTDQQAQMKQDGTPVTIADMTINALALRVLTEAFPEYGVVGEEGSTDDITQERLWFCDPIDGTKAYTWGLPTAMFSLGLIVGDWPVLGVAYDPFLDRMYTGVRGHGSFCNDKRLQVNDEGLSNGIIAVTSSITEAVTSTPKIVKELIAANVQLASFSGAVYKGLLVARGKTVAYVEDWTFPHDVAALHTIVTEAGGKISAPDGGPLDYRKGFRGALVSNGKVHDEIVAMVRK
jgi:fructose-1,6-bisphosphatase/inositol monophosphatase family enzyme